MHENHVKIVKNVLFFVLPAMALGVVAHSAAIPWLGWISVTGSIGSVVLIGWAVLNTDMSARP